MLILEKKSLVSNNTLGFDVYSDIYVEPTTVSELIEFLKESDYKSLPKYILGAGSNVLFKDNYNGVIICPMMKDIKIQKETNNHVFLCAGAGVEWDSLVEYCVDRGWGGLENLSYIPGKVGASPVQNIGAYGVEAKDTISEVEYVNIEDGEIHSLSSADCKFGYRDSIFKRELKAKVVITHVTYKLTKLPVLNTEYADVKDSFENKENKDIKDVRDIIISIRKGKLPEPSEIGNAGSFFKNPIVTNEKALKIKEAYPTIKLYPSDEGFTKLPAAWLIEQCGFKGTREGNVGVHANQALVLLAYKGANGKELLELAYKIQSRVKEKFDICIELEVNIC